MSNLEQDAIREATRRLVNRADALQAVNQEQSKLITELEAQHAEDDRKLALMEARAATEGEIAENTRRQLIWTQAELEKSQQTIKTLEVSFKEELESSQRRANAKENAMQGQLNSMQAEIARLKSGSAV